MKSSYPGRVCLECLNKHFITEYAAPIYSHIPCDICGSYNDQYQSAYWIYPCTIKHVTTLLSNEELDLAAV